MDDEHDDDSGRMHRRGRGRGQYRDHQSEHGGERPLIPGKATLTERLPFAHPAAVAQRVIHGARAAAARIDTMTVALRRAIADADYAESGRLALEIRLTHQRAERELAELDGEVGHGLRSQLAAAMRAAAPLIEAAPRLDAAGAGAEDAERAWQQLQRRTPRPLVATDGTMRSALGLGAIEVRVDDESRRITDAEAADGIALADVIYLHPERARPETAAGRAVLAHELVHLAQSKLPAATDADRDVAEVEAAALAPRVERGEQVRPQHRIDLSRAAADVHAPAKRATAIDAQDGATYLRLRLTEIVDGAVEMLPYEPGVAHGLSLDGPAFAHYLQARMRAYVDEHGVRGLAALARPADLLVLVASIVHGTRDVMNEDLLARVSTVTGAQLVNAVVVAFARIAPRVVAGARDKGDAAWLTRAEVAHDGHVDTLVLDALLRPAIAKVEVATTDRVRADRARAMAAARATAISPREAVTLLDGMAVQVQRAAELVGAWGEAIGEPVRMWIDHQRYWITAVSDDKLAELAPTIAAAASTVRAAHDGINSVVETHAVPTDGPDLPVARPVRAVLALYARAIERGHGPDAGVEMLGRAAQAARLVDLELVAAGMRDSRDAVAAVADAARTAGARTTRLANAPVYAAEARADEQALENALQVQRQRVVRGDDVDRDVIAEILTAAAELAIEHRIEALVLQSHTVLLLGTSHGAKDAASEMVHRVAGPVHRIEEAYRRGQADVASWRAGLAAPNPAEDRRRRSACVSDANAALAALSRDAAVQRAFQRAYEDIRDAQVHAAIVDLALLVGVTVLTGQVAGALGGLVRGIAVVEGAADLLLAERTASVLAGAVTIAADSALSTGAQHLILGSDGAILGDLATNAAALAILRPFATLSRSIDDVEKAVPPSWARLGRRVVLRGAIESFEIVASTAVTYVSARLRAAGGTASAEQQAVWLEQGLSIVLGKVIASRLDGFELRIKELGEDAGNAVRRRLGPIREAARAASDRGTTSSLLRAADGYRELLALEGELLASQRVEDPGLETAHAADVAALAPERFALLQWKQRGLEPLAADGSLWMGTSDQIQDAIDAAGPVAAASVVRDPDGRVRMRVDGQDIVLAPRGTGGPAGASVRVADRDGVPSSVPIGRDELRSMVRAAYPDLVGKFESRQRTARPEYEPLIEEMRQLEPGALGGDANKARAEELLNRWIDIAKRITTETGETDAPLRTLYNRAEKELFPVWQEAMKGLPVEKRARMAHMFREQLRLYTRDLMTDDNSKEVLCLRDLTLYGSRNGATFEALVEEKTKKYGAGDQAYEAIIDSSKRANPKVNQRITGAESGIAADVDTTDHPTREQR